jgi:hypothetical protein
VDGKALSAKFRKLRSKVRACAVFFSDSGAGHSTVIRRSFRGPVIGFRRLSVIKRSCRGPVIGLRRLMGLQRPSKLARQSGDGVHRPSYNIFLVPTNAYPTSQVCCGC